MESTQLRLALTQKIRQLLESDQAYHDVDRQIDELLQLDYQHTESVGNKLINEELYLGQKLCSEGLYTSYLDFYQLGKQLHFGEHDTFVDLGAGWGRSKLLYNLLFPKLRAIAIEYVKARSLAGQATAQRLGLNHQDYINADLFKTKLPLANYYFFYLQAGPLMVSLLEQMRRLAQMQQIQVIAIESHGDFLSSLDQTAPWLKIQQKIETKSHRHNPYIHIYQSLLPVQMQEYNECNDQILNLLQAQLANHGQLAMEQIPASYQARVLMQLSLNEKLQLIIRDRDVGSDEDYLWLASAHGLQQALKPYYYRSRTPDREFHQNQILGLTTNQADWWQLWVDRRNLGWQHTNWGPIRKIVISPHAQIEFATGKRVAIQQLS